jgi:hypothetical protein
MGEPFLRDLLRRAAPFALRAIDRELLLLQGQVERLSERRRELPAGSSRRRVTTANARWMRACETHDRLLRLREELLEARRG